LVFAAVALSSGTCYYVVFIHASHELLNDALKVVSLIPPATVCVGDVLLERSIEYKVILLAQHFSKISYT
jgi:hypothetical protein